ncbi:MAG: hypothetical protein WDM76_18290 [Limisphaerales bacterium]
MRLPFRHTGNLLFTTTYAIIGNSQKTAYATIVQLFRMNGKQPARNSINHHSGWAAIAWLHFAKVFDGASNRFTHFGVAMGAFMRNSNLESNYRS